MMHTGYNPSLAAPPIVIAVLASDTALGRVADSVPQVVPLHLGLAVMDGFDVLRASRSRPGCGVPIVVLTVEGLTRGDRRRLRGVTAVLGKGSTSLPDTAREPAKVVRTAKEHA